MKKSITILIIALVIITAALCAFKCIINEAISPKATPVKHQANIPYAELSAMYTTRTDTVITDTVTRYVKNLRTTLYLKIQPTYKAGDTVNSMFPLPLPLQKEEDSRYIFHGGVFRHLKNGRLKVVNVPIVLKEISYTETEIK